MNDGDPFAKDANRFTRTLDSGNKFSKPLDDIKTVQDIIKSDTRVEKRDEVLKGDKELVHENIKKERNFGPLQGFVDIFNSLRGKPSEKQKQRGKLAEKEKLEGMTIQDIIAPIDMEVDFTHLQMGNRFTRTYFVSGYPRIVGANWLSPIINFERSLLISTFYYPVDSALVLKKLKRKIGEMEATLYSQMESRKVVDPTMKVALTDAQKLQDAIAEGTEKYFHFAMYITITANSLEELEKVGRNVKNTLASMNVTAKPAVLQQEQGLISTEPLGLDTLFITRNMDTTSLASTFPFVTSELTMDHGVMYGINQHNKSLVIFDRFDMENANAVIFAKSGAGKSYFVKLEAIRSLMLGTEIIIIDPEKEFGDLCKAVGGSYIEFSQGEGAKMNPFELSGATEEGDDELRTKMLSLQGFFKVMLGGLTNVELSILDRALILTYREKGITSDPKTQHSNTFPLLEDLYKVLKGMAEPEARGLAGRLERYIIGSGAGIFNEQSTVRLDNPFTVFSIRDMPEELRPMVMYLMLDYIWTIIRKKRKRRLLIVDEAWFMMQSEDSARFLYGIAKRARKYYLGLSTISQDVEDFLKSEMGRAIITNSSIQFLMKQSTSAVDRLQQVFNLSEGEKRFLLTADRGQGIFFAGQSHVAIQVVSSQAEHELVTTDPKDLERRKAAGKQKERSIEELSRMYVPEVLQTSSSKSSAVSDEEAVNQAISRKKNILSEFANERLKYAYQPATESKEDKSDDNDEGSIYEDLQFKEIENYNVADQFTSLGGKIAKQHDKKSAESTHMTVSGTVTTK